MTQRINYRQGDWACANCNNVNFAFRDSCNRCLNKKQKQGFKSALFLTESNGDIPPLSDSNHEKKFSLEKLPSMDLKHLPLQHKYEMFEFEWHCQKCQKANQYYKMHCSDCGSQKHRKLTI